MPVSINVYRSDYSTALKTYADAGNLPGSGHYDTQWSPQTLYGPNYANTRSGTLDSNRSTDGFVARADSGKPFNYVETDQILTGSLDKIDLGKGVNSWFNVLDTKITFDFNNIEFSFYELPAPGEPYPRPNLVHTLVEGFSKPLGSDGAQAPFKTLHAYLDTQDIDWHGTSGNENFRSYRKKDSFDLTDGGADAIVFNSRATGRDTVTGFDADNASEDHDTLVFSTSVFRDAQTVLANAFQCGDNTILAVAPCNFIVLKNVLHSQLDAGDFAFV